MKKRLSVIAILIIIVQLTIFGGASKAQMATGQTKELNFVFLHGAGGTSGDMQLLSDTIMAKIPAYITEYKKQNPDINIVVDTLNRCYPNAVDIDSWANNIADSINNHYHLNNLILIGHSMGGKTALYMTAHDIGGLTDNIAMVATINSPVKNLSQYYFPGGVNYWQGQFLISQDQGVLSSLGYYDSSTDGEWVGTNNHWLALTSAESSPISEQFDTSGVDPLPRDMDDTIVPISAQYADGADVVYYGEYAHNAFTTQATVADIVADNILSYIFGDSMDFSVLADSGSFSHTAGLLPVAYKWDEITGEVPIDSGSFSYRNPSFFKWQEVTVAVGDDVTFEGCRSTFVAKAQSLPLISGLAEVRWLNDDEQDHRLYLRIRAAPLTSVKVEWSINGYEMETAVARDRYEVEITTGTPFTDIDNVTWAGTQPDDFRLQIASQAEGPVRWFDGIWRTYSIETRSVNIIDDMPNLFEFAPEKK